MKTTQSHTFRELDPEARPQDPTQDGAGWRFETLEHGGEYPDTMPQAIRAADAEGRSCIYVPVKVDGRVVEPRLQHDPGGIVVSHRPGWTGR